MNPRRRSYRCGYILFEAIVAMALLSAGLLAIHGALRQTVMVRGVARDYTMARFLLQSLMSEIQMQPVLRAAEGSGRCDPPNERFSYEWRIERVQVPWPPVNEKPRDPEIRMDAMGNITMVDPPTFDLPEPFMGRISVTLHWVRGGREFSRTIETLAANHRMWVPDSEHGQRRGSP